MTSVGIRGASGVIICLPGPPGARSGILRIGLGALRGLARIGACSSMVVIVRAGSGGSWCAPVVIAIGGHRCAALASSEDSPIR